MGYIYECYETNKIVEKEYNVFSQFVTAKKYSVLYEEIFREHKKDIRIFQQKNKMIYSIPFKEKPTTIYNGAGRMGLDIGDKIKKNISDEEKQIAEKIYKDINFADELMQDEKTALCFVNLFEEAEKYELLWVKSTDSKDTAPNNYKFIGYDVTYVPDYSGAFSIICDCFFIPRWHGFDDEGTLFIPDYKKLNSNGLFDSFEDAQSYMFKYLSEDWTERGVYCIVQTYRKEQFED